MYSKKECDKIKKDNMTLKEMCIKAWGKELYEKMLEISVRTSSEIETGRKTIFRIIDPKGGKK